MTPNEYAEVKLEILKLLGGFGFPVDIKKAEEVFKWVIQLPDNGLMRLP